MADRESEVRLRATLSAEDAAHLKDYREQLAAIKEELESLRTLGSQEIPVPDVPKARGRKRAGASVAAGDAPPPADVEPPGLPPPEPQAASASDAPRPRIVRHDYSYRPAPGLSDDTDIYGRVASGAAPAAQPNAPVSAAAGGSPPAPPNPPDVGGAAAAPDDFKPKIVRYQYTPLPGVSDDTDIYGNVVQSARDFNPSAPRVSRTRVVDAAEEVQPAANLGPETAGDTVQTPIGQPGRFSAWAKRGAGLLGRGVLLGASFFRAQARAQGAPEPKSLAEIQAGVDADFAEERDTVEARLTEAVAAGKPDLIKLFLQQSKDVHRRMRKAVATRAMQPAGGGGGGGGGGDEDDGSTDDADPNERRHQELLQALKRDGSTAWGVARGVMIGGAMQGIGQGSMGSVVQGIGGGVGGLPVVGPFLGAGLGIFGSFLQQAEQAYLSNASTLQQLRQQYRDFGSEARGVGYSIGYVVEQTSRLTNALGQQVNTVGPGRFKQYAGFARAFGLDDGMVAGTVGSISRLSDGMFFRATAGQRLAAVTQLGLTPAQVSEQSSSIALAGLHAEARELEMGQGRFGEYLQTYASAAEQQFSQTGHVDNGTAYAVRFASTVFGPYNERARGQVGLAYAQSAGRMASGDSSDAMRIFMMRAIGYGTKDGPGYIEAQEQLEAGITDPRNMLAMARQFQGMTASLDPETRRLTMYKMLEADAKRSGMNASGISAFVDYLAEPDSLYQLQGFVNDPGSVRSHKFTPEDIVSGRAFAKGGFGSVGQGLTTTASALQVTQESMRMALGQDVAQMDIVLNRTLMNVSHGLNELVKGLTGDQGGAVGQLGKLATSAEDASKALDGFLSTGVGRAVSRGADGTWEDFKNELRSLWTETGPAAARGTVRTRLNPDKHGGRGGTAYGGANMVQGAGGGGKPK